MRQAQAQDAGSPASRIARNQRGAVRGPPLHPPRRVPCGSHDDRPIHNWFARNERSGAAPVERGLPSL